jgi:MoaA/NifB/PqqE/SkfB family radical SAM enzyme
VTASALYPLPDRPGAYGDRAAFEASRHESGQWVFWGDRVELVLAGRYDEVKPLHVELSPTYLCNFSCPWCSCRSAREVWSDEDVFHHPEATPGTVMSCERLDAVVDRLAEHKIAIQWVGGEPTMHPGLLPAVARAREQGLSQCLFTNGSVLGERRVRALLAAELDFIRVSLDAVTVDVHRVHHGYRAGRPYAGNVLANLRQLVRLRRELGARTKVGVSLVVDERNLDDVVPTAHFVASLCEEHGSGAVDFVIVRPTHQFYNSQVELTDDTSSLLWTLATRGGELTSVLADHGVRVVVPEASFRRAPADVAHHGDACLSCGWFGEVTPTGAMVLCSDRYGNPDYFVGDLAEDGVSEIWVGEQRREVLDYVRETRCFKDRCPRNGRGFQLNQVFHEIERFRRRGEFDAVRRWIEDVRVTVARPEHSFFL